MGDCVQNCPVAARVENLESQAEELQAQNSSSHKEIFSRLNALEKAGAVQEVYYTSIMSKLDTLTQKVENQEQKPARRWEAAVTALIGALVGAVAAYLLAGGRIG